MLNEFTFPLRVFGLSLSSFLYIRGLHKCFAELCGLLTVVVTPTRCKPLNQTVQMERCGTCLLGGCFFSPFLYIYVLFQTLENPILFIFSFLHLQRKENDSHIHFHVGIFFLITNRKSWCAQTNKTKRNKTARPEICEQNNGDNIAVWLMSAERYCAATGGISNPREKQKI